MERKTSKNKTSTPKTTAKKAVKKPAQKINQQKVSEVFEIKDIAPIQESSKIEVLSAQTLPQEIVDNTKKSENLWDKMVSLFKDKIFVFSLVAILIILTIVFGVQKNAKKEQVKTEIVKIDSLPLFVKTDTLFKDNPINIKKIKDLESELKFTRENYYKVVKMLESR